MELFASYVLAIRFFRLCLLFIFAPLSFYHTLGWVIVKSIADNYLQYKNYWRLFFFLWIQSLYINIKLGYWYWVRNFCGGKYYISSYCLLSYVASFEIVDKRIIIEKNDHHILDIPFYVFSKYSFACSWIHSTMQLVQQWTSRRRG